MGASGWEYVARYQQDLGAALDGLRREVFAGDEWVKPDSHGDVFDLPEPGSVDDLTEQGQYWEFMGTSGTHSIVDMHSVVPADFPEDQEVFGTLRLLSDAEYMGCSAWRSQAAPSMRPWPAPGGSTITSPTAGGPGGQPCCGMPGAGRDRVVGLFRGLMRRTGGRPGDGRPVVRRGCRDHVAMRQCRLA
jgi:hypothetical protein